MLSAGCQLPGATAAFQPWSQLPASTEAAPVVKQQLPSTLEQPRGGAAAALQPWSRLPSNLGTARVVEQQLLAATLEQVGLRPCRQHQVM